MTAETDTPALPKVSRRPGLGGGSTTGITVAAALIAVCVAAGLCAVIPARVLFEGLPAPSRLVEILLPVVQVIADLSAAVTVGWLAAAAWLVPPRRGGALSVGGYRAVRAASLAAAVWGAAAAASIPLTLADVLGRPLTDVVSADVVLAGVSMLDGLRGAAVTAAGSVVIAVLARLVLRPAGAWCLLVVALVAVLPRAVTGHVSQALNHDVAVDSMIIHLFGVCLWVGGLIAVLGLARQRIAHLDVVLRRFSVLALVAFAAVAVSGLLNAWVRLPELADVGRTDYGRLLLAKSAALLLLGTLGYAHRRRTLEAARQGAARALLRLGTVEILIMAATLGMAAALARTPTPPPSAANPVPSELSAALGFDLGGPPTLLRLLTQWRFDWILGTAAITAAVLYLVGVRRLHRRGDRWPRGRTIGWVGGCAVLLVVTSSGLSRYAQAQFSFHMISHMLLAMIAPALLVLGGPVTLALRALPAATGEQPPGLRELLVAAMHSRFVRLMTHPLVVLPLFTGSFVALYFTGLFNAMVGSHLGHLLMNVHFLLVGYLYYWIVIGVDPAPRRLPPIAKLGILLVPVPFHAFFGLALMNTRQAIAATHYGAFGLPWVPDLAADQRVGGAIAWAATEAPIVIVVYALLAQWARSDARDARRSDRKAARHEDTELLAYNAMLSQLADQDQHRHHPHPEGPR